MKGYPRRTLCLEYIFWIDFAVQLSPVTNFHFHLTTVPGLSEDGDESG